MRCIDICVEKDFQQAISIFIFWKMKFHWLLYHYILPIFLVGVSKWQILQSFFTRRVKGRIATNNITHLKFESWIAGIRIKLQLLQLILWRHICYTLLIANFLIEWKNRCCMKSKMLNVKMSQNYLPQWSVFNMIDPVDPSPAYTAC